MRRIRHGHQVLAVVVAVIGVFTRTVLIALDLGQGVLPQVLGLVGRIDDGVRQTIFAIEVLGQVAKGIGFGEQVALVVVARLPGAAVRVGDLGYQGGQVVVFVGDGAAQRVGLFEQAGVFVVLEVQLVAVRQGQADHVAVVVQRDGVALAAVVSAGDDAVVGVVLHLQLAAEYVRGPADALGEVVAEMEVFAVAGPVLDHAGLAVKGFPAGMVGHVQGRCRDLPSHRRH